MNKQTLDILLDSEVLPQDQYDRIKKNAVDENGNWVWAPLRGFEKDYAEDYPTGLDGIIDAVDSDIKSGGQNTGSGFSQTGSKFALSHAFGRTSKANSYEIWGNAFKSHSEAIVRGRKNTETAQSLLKLLTTVSKDPVLNEQWGDLFEIVDTR